METKSKKPPQVRFDSGTQARIELQDIDTSLYEIESEAAFFASESAIKTTQMFDSREVQAEAIKSAKVSAALKNPNIKDNLGGYNNSLKEPIITPVSKAGMRNYERKKKAYLKRMKKKKEQIRTFSHIFGSVLLVVFIVSVSAFLSQFIVRAFLDYTGITVSEEFQVTVTIPQGATTEEIADILYEHNLISMPGFFTFYSRTSDKDGKYLSGPFNINSTMSYSQIVNTLQNLSISTETIMVNIPEGMTAMEIGQLLENHSVCRAEDFMTFYSQKMDVFKFELRIEHNPLRLNQLEGYLFPETYEFYIVNGLEDNPEMDTTEFAATAARTIYSHFNSQITNEMYRKMADMGFTLDEFMTIASMVQWEAAEYDDMRKVASVFLNRLSDRDNFPKLESDVTEKYANLSIKPYRTSENYVSIDKVMKAYDTYLSDGLPPGPVCNPGMAAMLAVLDAPNNDYDYLYFCANVETGEVFYAVTLAGHLENLERAGIDPSTLRTE